MISDWYASINEAKKVTKSFKTYDISFAVKHVDDGQKLEFLTVSFNSSELPHLHFISKCFWRTTGKNYCSIVFTTFDFFSSFIASALR